MLVVVVAPSLSSPSSELEILPPRTVGIALPDSTPKTTVDGGSSARGKGARVNDDDDDDGE